MAQNYFYGNEVSEYGKEHGYVDYGTLAKSFNHVLANDIMRATWDICDWEQVSGGVDNTEAIEELQEEIDALEDTITDDSTDEHDNDVMEQVHELEAQIQTLEEEQSEEPECFQYYVVDQNGYEILKDAGEIVYYNDALNLYVWGVTHWGTSWDYVLTDIPIAA